MITGEWTRSVFLFCSVHDRNQRSIRMSDRFTNNWCTRASRLYANRRTSTSLCDRTQRFYKHIFPRTLQSRMCKNCDCLLWARRVNMSTLSIYFRFNWFKKNWHHSVGHSFPINLHLMIMCLCIRHYTGCQKGHYPLVTIFDFHSN